MVSVVIADDHQVLRQGVKLLLEMEPDFRIAGEAADGPTALAVVKKVRPDILLLDLHMPRMHGLEVLYRLKSEGGKTKIVVLSMNSDDVSVTEAMQEGADGYVPKAAGSTELIKALRRVSRGQNHFCRSTKRRRGTNIYDTLSRRERTVLQLIVEGRSSSQIARQLFISRRTAETHRKNIMQKLHLHSQTEIVRFGIRHKLISA